MLHVPLTHDKNIRIVVNHTLGWIYMGRGIRVGHTLDLRLRYLRNLRYSTSLSVSSTSAWWEPSRWINSAISRAQASAINPTSLSSSRSNVHYDIGSDRFLNWRKVLAGSDVKSDVPALATKLAQISTVEVVGLLQGVSFSVISVLVNTSPI